MGPFRRKPKALGKDEKGRRYDLPLNKGAGSGFLVMLVALMTFLAMLALAASFALGAMTNRWTSGLEDKITVEIPAKAPSGRLLEREQLHMIADSVQRLLQKDPAVASAHLLDDNEIRDLVSPWLGDSPALDEIPVPALVSVELHQTTPDIIADLKTKIGHVAPQARLDTHDAWLTDLLRFTRALQFAAALLLLVIGVTTATAVAGAVRSRMAIHKADVELLHLMGAADNYITRQFQRHSLILALQGGVAGTVAAGLALLAIKLVAGKMDVSLLPDFRLGGLHIVLLACMPLAAALLAVLTARRTVLRVLEKMP